MKSNPLIQFVYPDKKADTTEWYVIPKKDDFVILKGQSWIVTEVIHDFDEGQINVYLYYP